MTEHIWSRNPFSGGILFLRVHLSLIRQFLAKL